MGGMNDEKVIAIVAAAGSSVRFGRGENKPFLLLGGKPVLVYSLELLQASTSIDEIVLVVRGVDREHAQALVTKHATTKVGEVVEGGESRQDSVYSGLQRVKVRGAKYVLVHDAVRPFLRLDHIEKVTSEAKQSGAAILAVRPKDTIKFSDRNHLIEQTLDRSRLWAAQTPQCFAFDLLAHAFEAAIRDGFTGTDESSLVERLGSKVSIIEGSYENIKITTREDLDLAEFILQKRVGDPARR
jgi:2-C-methyl-D-erythritol 4-phosphate cytidylyltransferase